MVDTDDARHENLRTVRRVAGSKPEPDLLRRAYGIYALIIWKFFGKMKPVKAAFSGSIGIRGVIAGCDSAGCQKKGPVQ